MKKAIFIFIFPICLISILSLYAFTLHDNISEPLLRLHIIGNSNSEYDQNIKLMVRDEIIKNLGKEFEYLKSKDSFKEKISENIDKIENIANGVLEENGATYKCQASLESAYIPRKTYNNIVLPEGIYESISIKLGNAIGENWWCVVYPPLCFTEDVSGDLSDEGKEYLKRCLSDESYSIIIDKEFKIEYKIKLIELFQKLKNKL